MVQSQYTIQAVGCMNIIQGSGEKNNGSQTLASEPSGFDNIAA